MSQEDFEAWLSKGTGPSDSVGILAHEDESCVVLLQSVGVNQVADAIKISRSAIRQIREIGEIGISLSVL